MVDRSPNFPALPLGDAIDCIRKVYDAEGRSSMPRLSVVGALEYKSLNGRSLRILGALKAYNLLEGRADNLKVSDIALTILMAPEGSDEKNQALLNAFIGPSAFALLKEQGPDASASTLRWHLIKANFNEEAADKLIDIFLKSKEVVNAINEEYITPERDEKPSRDDDQKSPPRKTEKPWHEKMPWEDGAFPAKDRELKGLTVGANERILQSGMLSRQASYRVIVEGIIGTAEIEKLIAKIEMDKDILAEPVPMPEGDDRDYQAEYEAGKSID